MLCDTPLVSFFRDFETLIQIIKQSARVEGRVHSDTNLIDMYFYLEK